MRHFKTTLCFLAVAMLGLPTFAAVPGSIAVQGKLTDLSGTPLPAGAKTFTFRIFDSQVGGVQIWPTVGSEIQSITSDAAGLWAGRVGVVSPLSEAVFSDTVRWLEIDVDGTVLPRMRLVAGSYAFRVATVDGASGGTITSKVSIGLGHTNSGVNGFVVGSSNTVSGPHSSVLGGSNNLAEGNWSAVVGGADNSALGGFSTVSGGLANSVWSNHAGIGAGSGNVAGNNSDDSAAYVGGGYANSARAAYSTVGGGQRNEVDSAWGAIGGGSDNHVTGTLAAIGGGTVNDAEGLESTVGGGRQNVAIGQRATISGGFNNWAEGQSAFVGGGYNNHAKRTNSAVAGGNSNNAGTASLGNHSFIGGGYSNQTEGEASVIAGGYDNQAAGDYSSISGGYSDTITATGDYSYLVGIGSKLTQDSTFMVDMPHIRFGKETGGYEFPTADGTNGQILATNGAGKLNWAAAPGIPIPLQLSGSVSGPLLDVNQSGTGPAVVGRRPISHTGILGSEEFGAAGYRYDDIVTARNYGMLGTESYGVFGKDSSSGYYGALGNPNWAVVGVAGTGGGWAGYFYGRLESRFDGNGVLTGPFVISNNGTGAGTAVAMHFVTERGGGSYGKGGIAYERTNSWGRGDLHFLQDAAADAGFVDLADAVMTVKNNGNVGVGTKDPAEKLEVKGNVRLDAGAGNGSMLRIYEAGTAKWALLYRPWASGKLTFANDIGGTTLMTLDPVNNRVGILQDSPSYRLDVSGDCHASSFPTSSDLRLKKNIVPLNDVLGKLEKIRAVSFDWNEVYDSLGRSTGRREIGVIAQEVEAQFPELVTHWGDQQYRAVDYGRLTAVLIEAVKELRAENRELEKRVDELESRSKWLQEPTEGSSTPSGQ